jgi:DNA invertase Pin-like site-specific DNA recombinase
MQGFFLDFLGWVAEDESTKKSGRVKAAVRKSEGKPTMSYKGNKWGRKSLSTQKKNIILELSKVTPKLTLRAIASQSGASVGVVHKLLTFSKSNNSTKLDVQELSN